LKKLKTVLFPILVVLVLLPVMGGADVSKSASIDERLLPYQHVIDKVNHDFGFKKIKIFIPKENKEKVYNNIKDMTTSQFEDMLKSEIEDELIGNGKPFDPQQRPEQGGKEEMKQDGVFCYMEQSGVSGRDGNGSDVIPLPNATGHVKVTPLQ
jgi:hypothetical protein